METVTRAQWNARPPDYTNALTLSKVDKFIVHYSGSLRTQTIRSIQDYCMDTKGHSDIDYNALVKDGKHYVGRGWNKGGHTLDNNSTSYGVCVVGQDGDATEADMNCVRDIYEMVCTKLGRRIRMTHHRGVLGASYTSCPGSELEAWVNSGMPYKETTGESEVLKATRGMGQNGQPPHDNVLNLQRQMTYLIEGTPYADRLSEHPLAIDGNYGGGTAYWVSVLLTGGEGNEVNGDWFSRLGVMVSDKRTMMALAAHMSSPHGGELPHSVQLNIPSYTVPAQTLTVPLEEGN